MIHLRSATLEDVSGVAQVHVDGWRETYRGIVPDDFLAKLSLDRRKQQWTDVLSRPERGSFHVAVDPARQGGIVGFVNAGATRSPELAFSGELYAIYLLKAFQGQGLGAALFAASARDLLASGHRSMLLWVLTENPTVRFYEHLGGKRVATKLETIGGKELEEVAMGYDEQALTTIGNRAP